MKQPEPVSPDRDEVNPATEPVEPEIRDARRKHGDELAEQVEPEKDDGDGSR